jgi:Ala-tRNA(Pro) deacylase
MACRENLETYLQQRGVSYEVQHHVPAFTAQKVASSEHIPGRMLAKVVMVFAGDDLNMLVMPAHVRLDLEATRAALGGRDVRLAHESEFAPSFPDCEPGAMPPFGNLYGIPVYVEEALGDNEKIVFQVGTHTETMSVPYHDFVRLSRPTVTRLGFVPGKIARAS